MHRSTTHSAKMYLTSQAISSSPTFTDGIASRGNGSYFINLGRQVEQDYAADGTHRDKATDYVYSATTDDLIRISR